MKADIYNYLYSHINNHYGVSGLMGNLDAESGLVSGNLENRAAKELGISDEYYVTCVDNGSYTNFVYDRAGFGLAQWTYWSRKEDLLNYAKSKNVSIADEKMQCEFLIKELKRDFSSVYKVLCNATSVKEASDIVLTKFEQPKNQDDAAKERRANMGIKIYNQFNSVEPDKTEKEEEKQEEKKEDIKVEPEKETVKYTVKSGDTLTKIAKKYNTTVNELVRLNNIADKNKIYVGQVLIVSVADSLEEKPKEPVYTKYKVVSGDTLTKISKKYKTTVANIVSWNNIKDANKIYVGQTLIVGVQYK